LRKIEGKTDKGESAGSKSDTDSTGKTGDKKRKGIFEKVKDVFE